MSDCLVTYFEAQARLTTWTDELEFLGYILCELIDKDGLNAVGYRCHQAIDLPAIIGLLRIQSEKPDGCLARMMSEDELKVFSWFMSKSKDIRNMMAHHKIRNADELNHLENIKERLGDMLEFAIRGAASDCGRYEVPWSPCHHICQTYMESKRPSTVMVPLNKEPLLFFRGRVLRDHDLRQRQMLHRNPKCKATEEGRRKQKDDFEAALLRKQQRKDRDIATRSNHQSVKLERLEKKFTRSQELGYNRLNKVKARMREEQELFYRQRAEILKDGLFYPTVEDQTLLITILLAISSPLWLTVMFIYNVYSRTRGSSRCV